MPSPSEHSIADLLAAYSHASLSDCELVLRSREGSALTDDERKKLLLSARRGEVPDLAVEIIAYAQAKKPKPLPRSLLRLANRNFVRFDDNPETLGDFASSFTGRRFLRDHNSWQLLARGGKITESILEDRAKDYRFRQDLLLQTQWAIEAALDTTLDQFSIGWRPKKAGWEGWLASAKCSVCEESFFSGCSHYPGQLVKAAGKEWVVEVVWSDVTGFEVSGVGSPAVEDAKIVSIRSQLSEMPGLPLLIEAREAWKGEHEPATVTQLTAAPVPSSTIMEVLPELAEELKLSQTSATPEAVLSAVKATMTSAAKLEKDCTALRLQLAEATATNDALRNELAQAKQQAHQDRARAKAEKLAEDGVLTAAQLASVSTHINAGELQLAEALMGFAENAPASFLARKQSGNGPSSKEPFVPLPTPADAVSFLRSLPDVPPAAYATPSLAAAYCRANANYLAELSGLSAAQLEAMQENNASHR